MERSDGYLNRHGVNLHYRIYRHEHAREDEPRGRFVLVHGVGSPMEYWLNFAEALAEQGDVLVFDHRGCGRSSTPLLTYSIDEMEKDLLAITRAVEWSRYTLLGVSLGGLIAQRHAIRRPDRVSSLVLVSTHAGVLNARMPRVNPLTHYLDAARLAPRKRVEKVLSLAARDNLREEQPELYDRLVDSRMNAPYNHYGNLGHFKAGLFFFGENLARVHCPVLVAHGEKDRVVPAANARILLNRLRNASYNRLILFPRGGHLAIWEEQELFLEKLRDFSSGDAS